MQDNELCGKPTDQNDKLMFDYAVTRRQSRSLYRNWAILSKKAVGGSLQSQTNLFSKISTSSIGNYGGYNRESSNSLIEDRADEIVRHMEQSQTLVEDNPKSNNERIETLREMTEFLTLKRSVKRKLMKSLGSNSKTLSFSKRLRYRISYLFSRIPIAIKQCLSSCELWYSSLKEIEGHFGSSVASYFKFLRKLFLLNTCIFILMLFFIMIPQLLFRFVHFIEDNKMNNTESSDLQLGNDKFFTSFFSNQTLRAERIVMVKSNPYEGNDEFRLGNIFTGEGFLTNTILFYGYYTNTSLKLIEDYSYHIPVAYFFTSVFCYVLIFFFLFISVAVSYRKCYIETSGGLNNTFTNKVFCGWDFGIATKQAAELKSKSICIEIKELLDELSQPAKKKTCANTFYTTAISFSLNGILLFLLGVGGMYSWKYLDQQMTKADTATTMMMWLVLTLVIAIAPVLFSLIAHVEGFESRSSALYMTLIRTFTLYAVVIAVVVAYRINRSAESECWETILGQDMYRLVLLDFIFGLIGTALSEFIRYRIFVKMWKKIGCPEFDIARSSMNLIYNQTLFYIGLYFSPALSLVITIKLFLMFYIKKWGAVYNCKPFLKPWKAAQAHTVYLSIAFFAFFCVVISYGYIITSVKTSNCGPFRGEKYMYESLLVEMLPTKDSTLLMAIYYITRPGVVGIVLMAMVLGVYYMRAVALARIHVVKHLRNLLRLKAEDRKLLLLEIAKYSKNQTYEDEHPDSSSEMNSPKFVRHKLSKSRESFQGFRKKSKINEEFKKTKQNFSSSLINLQSEPEARKKSLANRNSIFNSVQNISSFGKTNAETTDGDFEDISVKRVQTSGSVWKESCDDASVRNESVVTLEKTSDPECSNSRIDEEPTKVHLNFNPVFTKSFPLNSDEDDECMDSTKLNTTDRLPPIGQESQLALVNNENGETIEEINLKNFPSNYNRFEERVPSRISFESSYGKKLSKRKKKR